MENINKLKGLNEVFFDFTNQWEVAVKQGEKLNKKKMQKCFNKLNLEKNLGFFFFSKKNLREVATNLFGPKMKNLIY